jgi:radical SAM superfamily enzyme YgiQ (UPF0313 family)
VGYGLLHIATCLAQRGYRVAVWNLEDALRRGVSLEVIQKNFRQSNPWVVGVELNWLVFSAGAIQIAELLRGMAPDVPIVFGGTHATIFATEIMQKYHHEVTAVLKGEAEKTLLELVENFESKKRITDVGGLVTCDEGVVREVPRNADDLYANIDDIPPYSSKLIQDVTTDLPASASLTMRINTCRGPCKYQCVYCLGSKNASFSGRSTFSVHSPGWIIDQIKLLMDEGVRAGFVFQDDLFAAKKRELTDLTEAMQREKINDTILGNATAVPGSLDRETLQELSKAGIFSIDYGCESGSDRILRLIKRPSSRQAILSSVKDTISSGIIPITWWMTGLPGEKAEDVEETADLIVKTTQLGAIPGWITPCVALPRTELFERADEYGVNLRLKSFDDFSIFSETEARHYAWYPEIMSHETQYMDKYAILQASVDLKRTILKDKTKIIRDFMEHHSDIVIDYHPRLTARILEASVTEIIESLPLAFF